MKRVVQHEVFCTAWSLLLLMVVVVFCCLARTSDAFYLPSLPRTSVHLVHATISPSGGGSSTTGTTRKPRQESQALLEALLDRYNNNKNNNNNQDTEFDIGASIERLSQARVTFDPAQCFNGPLYAVLHQQGPKKPLWEKIGISLGGGGKQKKTNLQGQKYMYKSETNDYDIVNYAEIFGKGLFIQVEGTAEGRGNKGIQLNSKQEQQPTSSFLDGIANLFSSSSGPQQSTFSKNLLKCPCDIVANVAGGGLFVGGNKVLPLDFIQGTGVVRVLYADPQLRILESPYQNNGGWEDQGLIVVQVREDLLQ